MAEAAAARNFITSGAFERIDEGNREIIRQTAKDFLGVPDAPSLTEAMHRAFRDSTQAIRAAVPEDLSIPIPEPLALKFQALAKSQEPFEFPAGATLTGAEARNLRTDLSRATKSASALVRSRSREALAMLDEALEAAPGVNSELYAGGRRQYQRWATLDRGAAIAREGPDMGERLNPVTVLGNLEKGFGKGTRTGGKSLPRDAERLRKIAEEAASLRSPVPNSGTPTGQSLAVLGADLATTGGIGTTAAFLGARLAESPAGYGFYGGLMTDPGMAGAYGATIAKLLAAEAQE